MLAGGCDVVLDMERQRTMLQSLPFLFRISIRSLHNFDQPLEQGR
jgi:hypothetical protein